MVLEVMPSAKAQIQFAEPIVITPAQTLWSSDFEVWPSALFTTVLKYWSSTGVNNSRGAEWDRSAASGTEAVGNLIGLTIGRSYTLRLVAKANTAGPTFAINAGGVTSTATALTSAYAPYSVTFTASSVSHTLSFITNAATKVYLDNISLDANPVLSYTTDLPVAEGDLSLDRSRVPYAVSRITVPSSDSSLPESLKPLARQRVKITAQSKGRWGNGEPTYSQWAQQRRNQFQDPRGTTTSSTYWLASGFTLSLRTDMGNPVPTAVRFTRSTTAAARISLVVGNFWPNGGRSVRLLATVRASEATPNVGIYARSSAASNTGQVLMGTVNIPAGVSEIDVTGLSNTDTLTNTSGVSLILPTSTTTGQTLDITKVVVETAPTMSPAPYFDGSLVNDNPLVRYTWGSTPNGISYMDTRTVVAPGKPLWIPADTRTFDLAMLNREVSHDGRSVQLDLATDEALLLNYAPLVDDNAPMQHQDSLRSIINYVLNKAIPGAQLEAGGAADRAFKVLADATNLWTDPRFASGLAGAYVSTTQDQTWPGPQNGIAHNGIHLYSPTQADSFVSPGGDTGAVRLGMQAGRTYTFSAEGSVRTVLSGSTIAGAPERERALVVHHRIGNNGWSVWTSPQVPNVPNSSARVSVTFTLPAGTTEAFVRAYHGRTAGTITWAKMRLSETHRYSGPHNTEFFQGFGPNTSEYAYSWDGASDQSTSKRIALIDRSPDLLVWRAGESAWDFLETLKNAAGLRLFCDEQRRWWLVNSPDFNVPGRISVRADNAIEGSDTVDASADAAAEGVIARFNWRDNDGNARTKDDVAGNPGRAYLVEFDRPYPGPGTAAAILTRRTGQGRTQDVTVLSDLTATPGQEISITLPGTTNQLGTLQSAQFDLANGTMRLESTGLTEVTPGSWLAQDPSRVWGNTPDTTTWSNS